MGPHCNKKIGTLTPNQGIQTGLCIAIETVNLCSDHNPWSITIYKRKMINKRVCSVRILALIKFYLRVSLYCMELIGVPIQQRFQLRELYATSDAHLHT